MEIEKTQSVVLNEMQEDEELYQKMKRLEEEIEFIDLQEKFIKTEHQNLQRELIRAKEELKRI